MPTLTIGQLANRFGLSRSTLLYYDRIGLLRPCSRTAAGYRLYAAAEVERMERIDTYRQAGLPLADIARLLAADQAPVEILERRLRRLAAEQSGLRVQQRLIVALLRQHGGDPAAGILDKDRWVAILRATGLGDDDLHRWHIEFERQSPDGHQAFLESLGLGCAEIDRIRAQAGNAAVGS